MDTDLGPLTLATLVDYIRVAMEIAEDAIEAGDKAAYAQEIILRLIAESDMTDAEKELCRTIVSTGVLRNIFTLVVDATKGKINVNKIKKDTRRCCRRWFSCLCGKAEKDADTNTDADAATEEPANDTPVPVEPAEPAAAAAAPATDAEPTAATTLSTRV